MGGLDDILPAGWQPKAPVPGDFFTQPPVESSPDLTRILALPRRPPPDLAGIEGEALVELISSRYARHNPNCRCKALQKEYDRPSAPCVTRLRPVQAWSLFEVGKVGGLIGFIGVGHGKTLLDLLSIWALKVRLALLLVPKNVLKQLIADYVVVGEHFKMPSLVVHGIEWNKIIPGAPILHVMPYSLLCRPGATSFLRQLKPEAIIADEAQKLRHPDTATTSRVMRYFHENRSTKFCAWSGSFTNSSIADYAHHCALALREGSPLPVDPQVVSDWARAIDPSDFPAPVGALKALCSNEDDIEDGYHLRLVETAGVVHTITAATKAELVIQERKLTVPDVILQHLKEVRNTWTRPDGEEIILALDVVKCLREIAAGFYYRWEFPRHEKRALIEEWLEARKTWNKEVRERLKQRREHLDSPQLCERAAQRAWGDREKDKKLPEWKASAWPRWREVKGKVKPVTVPVYLDDFLAQDAANWGMKNKGIVWYAHAAFGQWVASISGLPLHGGGPDAGQRIGTEKGDRSIVASVKSHGTGRDGLQRLFADQLVTNSPSSPEEWEQTMGRLHRDGQEAPIVRVYFYRHTAELSDSVDKAMVRALYVQKTTRNAQKLRLGWKL